MIVLKRINNNAVLCIDPAGHQVVALGKGLAQCTVGKDVDLNLVDHTFYDVEPRYVELMRDLSLDYLEVSAQIVNVARGMLGYDLSPNIEVALADHIQFAIQRMREHIYLSAPLSYDLQQNYPLEYKIAQWSLGLIRQHFGVAPPSNEISGIAMCLINGAYSSAGASSSDEAEKQDNLLEQIISLIESNMGASVSREGFGFARFATHLQYLIRRVASGDSISSDNSEMYQMAAADNRAVSSCVDAIAALISSAYRQSLTDEEKLYLIIHVNRICSRSDVARPGNNPSA